MWAIGSRRANRSLVITWAVFAATNAVLMFVFPGEETIPYHLIWASFAFLYGMAPWRTPVTIVVFVVITAVTAVPLIRHAAWGIIGWEECSEIVLMGVIAGMLVWHVKRHEAASARLDALREADRVRAANRELATRFGSHELRTRLTIARGLTDLIRSSSHSSEVRNDAELAVAELDKAVALSTSLMTLMRVDGQLDMAEFDLDELIDGIARRWTGRAARRWVISSSAGLVVGNAERMEAALDCLVENAVKFTGSDDTITLGARTDGAEVVILVSDTGAGIPADDLPRVTELFHTSGNAGARAGNGLGLPIVRAAVEARGGTLHIASSLGEGTRITIRLPRRVRPNLIDHRTTSQVAHRPGSSAATAPDAAHPAPDPVGTG